MKHIHLYTTELTRTFSGILSWLTTITVLVATIWLLPFSVKAQPIQDADFEVQGNTIVVSYRLSEAKAGQTYNVTLFYSTDNGKSWQIPITLIGDVGKTVKPGNNKRIVWQVMTDLPGGLNASIGFKLTATLNERLTFEPEMVFVQGGSFIMGDTFGEGEADERPAHSVKLSDYYIGKYEVTFEEYDLFCEATGREKPDDFGWGRGKRPVMNVSWEDATAYCQWLSKESGKKYTLPTEAQWEYAAREGGKKVRFGNGMDIIDPAETNFDGSESYKETYSRTGTYRGQTMPADSFKPNALGIYNMTGNVWEWCRDWYDKDYYGKSPSSDPENTRAAIYRVLRGGSWGGYPTYCRIASRGGDTPSRSNYYNGFRVVLVP